MAQSNITRVETGRVLDEKEGILSRLLDVLLSDSAGGYISRFGLEYVPIPFFPLLAFGDALGLAKGVRTYKDGRKIPGFLKVITSIIPFFPTAPTHAVIDTFFGTSSKK